MSAVRSLDCLQQLSRTQNHGNQTGLRTRIYDEKLSEVHHQRQPAGEITSRKRFPADNLRRLKKSFSGGRIVFCIISHDCAAVQSQAGAPAPPVFHPSVDSRILSGKFTIHL